MKAIQYFFIIFLFVPLMSLRAQFSSGFTYKAVIDDNGTVLPNAPITLMFTVLESGSPVYEETHSLTTDSHGIVFARLGEGTVINGNFQQIEWGTPKSIVIQVNKGSGFETIGTFATKYVPYAKFADVTGQSVPERLGELQFVRVDNTPTSLFVGENAGSQDDGTDNRNTAIGNSSMQNNQQGEDNTALGHGALLHNVSGNYNVAVGSDALLENDDENANVAVGSGALKNNGKNVSALSDAIFNTAVGTYAMEANINGSYNTVAGYMVGYANRSGGTAKNNTAIGYKSLYDLGIVDNKVSIGYKALGKTAISDGSIAVGSESASMVSDNGMDVAIGYKTLQKDTSMYIPMNVGFGAQALMNSEYIGTRFNFAFGFNALKNINAPYAGYAEGNTAFGNRALYSTTEANDNTAMGYQSMYFNTTGAGNTAFGYQALANNTTGDYNVAVGYKALFKNTDRSFLVAVGDSALYNNGYGADPNDMDEASGNVAVGYAALSGNTIGFKNTAIGAEALKSNTSGEENVAIGTAALRANMNGHYNTAIGSYAMANHQGLGTYTMGHFNTAVGYYALKSSIRSFNNIAVGYWAGFSNKYGDENIHVGYKADFALDSAYQTTALGYMAGGVVNAGERMEFGNASVSWIGGQVTWSTISDGRFKKNVREDVPGLSFIKRLHPVTYHWDIHKLYSELEKKNHKGYDKENWPSKYDIENIKFSGFLAQEVEQAARETGFDFSGVHKGEDSMGMYSLSYGQFVVPLVKAVQEQQSMLDDQNGQIQSMQKRAELQNEQLDRLEQQTGALLKKAEGLEKALNREMNTHLTD